MGAALPACICENTTDTRLSLLEDNLKKIESQLSLALLEQKVKDNDINSYHDNVIEVCPCTSPIAQAICIVDSTTDIPLCPSGLTIDKCACCPKPESDDTPKFPTDTVLMYGIPVPAFSSSEEFIKFFQNNSDRIGDKMHLLTRILGNNFPLHSPEELVQYLRDNNEGVDRFIEEIKKAKKSDNQTTDHITEVATKVGTDALQGIRTDPSYLIDMLLASPELTNALLAHKDVQGLFAEKSSLI